MDGRRSITGSLGNSSTAFDVDRGEGCCDPDHKKVCPAVCAGVVWVKSY
jgi:hypothetical protein